MFEKKMNQVYLRELFGSVFIYVLVLFTSIWFAKGMEAGILRTAIALTPMVPVLAMLWAITRHLKRIDEYVRQWSMENIAMAGALTAVFSLTYGFMEGIDFPRLSMFVVWGVFMGGWSVIACVRKALES